MALCLFTYFLSPSVFFPWLHFAFLLAKIGRHTRVGTSFFT
jgi:hypothetical protein